MNFYKATIKIKDANDPESWMKVSLTQQTRKEFWNINAYMGVKCDVNETLSVLLYDAKQENISVIFAVDMDKSSLETAKNYICNFIGKQYAEKTAEISDIQEISVNKFNQLGARAESNGFIRRFRDWEAQIGTDYLDISEFLLREDLLEDETFTYEEAVSQARKLLAEDSFVEELARIYSDENDKHFWGNPVHYRICTSNSDAAYKLAVLLSRALKANGRLSGNRISRVSDISYTCYDQGEFDCLIELSAGNVVVIEMDGIHKDFCKNTRGYARVVDFMDEVLRRNHLKTLCILVENSRYPGFSKKLLDKLSGSMDIIDLKVGSGDRRSAEDYLYELLKSTGYEVDPDEPKKLLPDKMVYTVDEIYEIHDDWVKTGLKNRVYKSYRNCTFIDTKKTDGTPRAYETLQKLVGLTEIKELVDRIIDTVKVRKIRDSMGMTGNAKALHMVFTGNPGTAKTTVARLIGQIFAEEKILSSGAFVECGRADLVGKYVGWTAKNVRERFKDAKGGVLFIDEAYALADGTNTFGDEAINTLVQEMENHRSDVVVILAGYPDKMKTLLDRNEGLRSRITFHLNFPDYNAGELQEIIRTMAEQEGYTMDEGSRDRCLEIFEKVCLEKDFGNGRFARNLLEQAQMAHSQRIMRNYNGNQISQEEINVLRAEDFEDNISMGFKTEIKQPIGFLSFNRKEAEHDLCNG